MAKNHSPKLAPRRKSKRERRMKAIIYLMIVAMILSTLAMGLTTIL